MSQITERSNSAMMFRMLAYFVALSLIAEVASVQLGNATEWEAAKAAPGAVVCPRFFSISWTSCFARNAEEEANIGRMCQSIFKVNGTFVSVSFDIFHFTNRSITIITIG